MRNIDTAQRLRMRSLCVGAYTHAAGKPRNEDAVAVATGSTGLIAVVADGISTGGMGDMMSALATRAAVDVLRAAPVEAPRQSIEQAVMAAQRAVLARKEREQAPRSGTTLVCAWLLTEAGGVRAHIAGVGDSRAYLLTKSRQLRQLTQDHSTSQRLTHAIGFPLDLASLPGFYHTLLLRNDDALLLCSDGVYRVVSSERMAALVSGGRATAAARALVNAAREAGTLDNASAIVIRPDARVRPFSAGLPLWGIGVALALALAGLLLLTGTFSPAEYRPGLHAATAARGEAATGTPAVVTVMAAGGGTTILVTITAAPTDTPTGTATTPPTATPTRRPVYFPTATAHPSEPAPLASHTPVALTPLATSTLEAQTPAATRTPETAAPEVVETPGEVEPGATVILPTPSSNP